MKLLVGVWQYVVVTLALVYAYMNILPETHSGALGRGAL